MGKKKTFSVYEASPKKFYVVTYENRKRVYLSPSPKADAKHLPTRADAQKAADRMQRNANALDFRELSPLQRREYWELTAYAKAHGLDLKDAVEKGCGRSTSWPARIHDHTQPFLDFCRLKKKLRSGSVDFYKHKLAVLFRDYPRATFGDFPGHRLKELIHSAGNGHEWESGAVRALSAFWNWGARQNPPIAPHGITRTFSLDHPKRPRSIDFLTLAEAARFLHAVSSRWSRSAFALMAFCGIRKSEAEQMRWEWINPAERSIHIPEHVSKTPGGRLIETAPRVLWQWLQPPPNHAGSVCAHRLKDQLKACAAASRIPRWPQSGLRHTFVTYHYAAFKDRSATIAISGHDGDATTLEQKYRAVSTTRGTLTYLPTAARGRLFLALTPLLAAAIAKSSDPRIQQL